MQVYSHSFAVDSVKNWPVPFIIPISENEGLIREKLIEELSNNG